MKFEAIAEKAQLPLLLVSAVSQSGTDKAGKKVEIYFDPVTAAVLVLLLRGLVARHFGPRQAYALWAIPAARMLLPPLPTWPRVRTRTMTE